MDVGGRSILSGCWGEAQRHARDRLFIAEHIELPAKLLDYFLPSIKSNINQNRDGYGVQVCGWGGGGSEVACKGVVRVRGRV